MIRRMIILILLTCLALSIMPVLAQDETTPPFDIATAGMDVIVVMENSTRITQSDPDTDRFESVEFLARLLADDALLYQSGAVHRLSLVTYSSQGSSIQRQHVPFGPFNATLTDADLTLYTQQLGALGEFSGITPQGGAETWGFQGTAEVQGVPTRIKELIQTDSLRPTLVLVVSAGVPQQGTAVDAMEKFLDDLRDFTQTSTLDFFFLNNLTNADFNMSTTSTIAAPVWNLLQSDRPNGLEGEQYILTDGLTESAKSVERLPNFFFNRVVTAMGNQGLPFPIESQPTITIPAFVSAMTIVSFGDGAFGVTAPTTATSLNKRDLLTRTANGAVYTLIAPVAGEYQLNNLVNGRIFLRAGEATLDTPTPAPQLVAQPLNYTIRDAFGEVFGYTGVTMPTITANLSGKGELWDVVMTNINNGGAYSASFVPPYAVEYDLSVNYSLPFTGGALPNSLQLDQAVPTTKFTASPLALQIDEDMLRFELFQAEDVTVRVDGAENKTLAGNPQITLVIPSQLTTATALTLPLNAGYAVNYEAMTATRLAPDPINFTASLNAILPANRDNKTEYTIIENATFSVAIATPTANSSAGTDNVMLRAVNFSLDPNTTVLTDSDVTPYNAVVCVDVNGGEVDATYKLDANLSNAEFIPYTATEYAYTVTIREQSCAGNDIATITPSTPESRRFVVDPLYIGFLDGDNATTIGTLGEYLPYSTSLGLFVNRGGTYTRYTGTLNDAPVINSDNTAVKIGGYSNNAYAVQIDPQILVNGETQTDLAFNLTAVSSADSAKTLTLPIYTGATVQNNGAVTIPITRATATLTEITPRQFNNATFAVRFDSTLGGNSFDANAINANGWGVMLNLSHTTPERQLAWNIPLTLDDNNHYQATVPIPFAGAYNATVTIETAEGAVAYPLNPTIASAVTLVGIGTRNEVDETNTPYTFTYEWRDESGIKVTTFDNVPAVKFEVKKVGETDPHQRASDEPLNADSQYVYPVTFLPGTAGTYTIHATWTTPAPIGADPITDSTVLTTPELKVGGVIPFSVTIEGQSVQTYYTPILPLVNLGLRQERILVANIVLQDGGVRYGITAVYPNITRDNVRVRFTDGEGKCAPFTDADCILQDDKWDFRVDGGVGRVEIRDIDDSTPYQIQAELQNVAPDGDYYLNPDGGISGVLPVQLRLNLLTFGLPIFYFVATFIITSIAFFITRIVITRRDSKAPIMEGYLRFEDVGGKFVEWQEDLKARRRNRLDIRKDKRLRAVNVRRLVVNTVEGKPDEVQVRVWWAPPRKFSTLIYRMLPLDQLPALVKRTLSLDKPEPLFAGSTQVVYSLTHKPLGATTSTSTTQRPKPFVGSGDGNMATVSMPVTTQTTVLKRPTPFVPPTTDAPKPTATDMPKPSVVDEQPIAPKSSFMELPTVTKSSFMDEPTTPKSSFMEQPTMKNPPVMDVQPPLPKPLPIDEAPTWTMPIQPPPSSDDNPPESDSKPLPPPKRRSFTDNNDDDPFNKK